MSHPSMKNQPQVLGYCVPTPRTNIDLCLIQVDLLKHLLGGSRSAPTTNTERVSYLGTPPDISSAPSDLLRPVIKPSSGTFRRSSQVHSGSRRHSRSLLKAVSALGQRSVISRPVQAVEEHQVSSCQGFEFVFEFPWLCSFVCYKKTNMNKMNSPAKTTLGPANNTHESHPC